MQVTLENDKYKITFPYDPELVAYCRSLQGSRWNGDGKFWTAARSLPNAIALSADGHFHDAALLAGYTAMTPQSRMFFHGDYKWNINATLMQHQKEWVEWCISRPRAMCVAEQGLGKSLMAMLWLDVFGVAPEQVLVICPASLMYNWRAEFSKFTGVETIIVAGTPPKRASYMAQSGLHIINYEAIGGKDGIHAEVYKMLSRKKTLIIDELHYCKHPNSQRSKLLHKMHDIMPNILGLTGTPVSQGAQDYYSQFKIIEAKLLGPSFLGFRNRYCIEEPVRGAPAGVTRITGYRRMEELTRIIAPYVFTRLKEDCLDLPPKNYATIYVEMGTKQRKAYMDMKRSFVLWVNSGLEPITQQNFLARMMKLAQISQGYITYDDAESNMVQETFENPKLDALRDFIDALPDGDQVIVICRFRPDIVNIATMLRKHDVSFDEIHGGVSHKDGSRHAVAERFQSREFRVLVAQIASIAHGFTLTSSAHIVFFSNDFNYVNREQAEARIHRISQTRSVTYTDILCAGTIDEDIHHALTSKKSSAEILTDMRKKLTEEANG